MQIKVAKLRNYLALVAPAVAKRATLPVILNVLVSNGKIIANNLECKIAITLPEASGTHFLLPFKSTIDLLKYVPGDEMLAIDSSKKGVTKFSWHGGSSAQMIPSADDFPNEGDPKTLTEGMLDGDMLISALSEALPYCASEEIRPVLCGVTLYLGNALQVAAADGFQLSYQALKMEYPWDKPIIIPPGTVVILEHLWSKQPAAPALQNTLVGQLIASRKIRLTLLEDDTMRIDSGNISITSKLITGTPPDHLSLLGSFKNLHKVKFMGPELLNAVKRLSGIAREGTGITKLKWTDTEMSVSASAAEIGETEAVIPLISIERPPVDSGEKTEDAPKPVDRIAVNCKYLLGYLAGKDGVITMGVSSRSAPATFGFGNHPIVAIMPMFVQWDDEPAPAAEESKAEATPAAENSTEAEAEEKEEITDDTLLEVPPGSEVHNILLTDEITVGELKNKIENAKAQRDGWQEAINAGSIPENERESAEQAMAAWEAQITNLQAFLDEQGAEEAEEGGAEEAEEIIQ